LCGSCRRISFFICFLTTSIAIIIIIALALLSEIFFL